MKAGQFRGLVAWAPLLLGLSLGHCALATEGLGPENGGLAGSSLQGSGGAGEAGAPVAGDGPGGAGGAGEGGAAGSGGAGGGAAGSGGAGGAGGAGGSAGGGPLPCDVSKGEFELVGGGGSCFFLLNANAPRRAELEREKWQWAEARDDCDRLGGTLASLASLAEFDATRDAIDAGAEGTVIAVTRDVWIGGSTSLTQASNLDQLCNIGSTTAPARPCSSSPSASGRARATERVIRRTWCRRGRRRRRGCRERAAADRRARR